MFCGSLDLSLPRASLVQESRFHLGPRGQASPAFPPCAIYEGPRVAHSITGPLTLLVCFPAPYVCQLFPEVS